MMAEAVLALVGPCTLGRFFWNPLGAEVTALLSLLVLRWFLEGYAPVYVSLLLRTFQADPWLPPCVPPLLLKMIGMMALASAYLVAAIFATKKNDLPYFGGNRVGSQGQTIFCLPLLPIYVLLNVH